MLAAGAIVTGAVGLGFLLYDAPRGRSLSDVERRQVLPALARSSRPALQAWRETARRILETCPADVPAWIDLGPPPEVSCRGREVELPPDFPQALALMEEAVRGIAGVGAGLDPKSLAAGDAAAALDAAFREASRLQVPGNGGTYWASRLGVLLRREGRLTVVLASEPLEPLLQELHTARGSWDRVLAIYRRAEPAIRPGDPGKLIANLLVRDGQRHYDDERRRLHLELTLQAVLPNLVETVTLDTDAILELGAAGDLSGEMLAVVAIRQNTSVNQNVGQDDLAFAGTVAPLFVAVFGADGSATVTRLPAPPGGAPLSAALAAPVRAPAAPPGAEDR